MLILYGRNVCGVSNITKMNSSIGNDFTTNIKNIFKKHTFVWKEPVARKISQNSHKNTCAGISF